MKIVEFVCLKQQHAALPISNDTDLPWAVWLRSTDRQPVTGSRHRFIKTFPESSENLLDFLISKLESLNSNDLAYLITLTVR
jgi:hypothetical protein